MSHEIIGGMGFGVFVALLFNFPLIYALLRIRRVRRCYKAAANDPFKELPLRPPGESLRLKIDELNDKQTTFMVSHIVASMALLMILFSVPSEWRVYTFVILLLVVIADAVGSVPPMIKNTQKLWDLRLAYMGERAVAESLNTLLADGYRVFHDLPFENFNIDHVVVGPHGLYVVETKSRRKPKTSTTAKHAVTHEGEMLQWPRYSETKTIAQALRNAKTLAELLSRCAGEIVSPQAIVAVPGWWTVRDVRFPSVWVLNPLGIKAFIEKDTRAMLTSEQIQRIAFQLEQRCRLKENP